jgi:hypothetical protein
MPYQYLVGILWLELSNLDGQQRTKTIPMWRIKSLVPVFLICAISIAISSCNNTSDKPEHSETISLKFEANKPPAETKLSELAERVRIIPLETKPECYINAIGRVFVGEKNILVMSPGSKQHLFLFTLDGKFVRKIGRPGKGPGEYTDIRDISVFEEQNEVYLSTGLRGDMIAYNFDGSFVRSIRGIQGASESKRIGKYKTAYYSHLDFEIKVVNEKAQDTSGYIPIDSHYKSPSVNMSGSVHNGFFFSALGKSTIWRFTEDSFQPAIVCDFGSASMTFIEYLSTIGSGKLPSGKILVTGFPFYNSGYYHFLIRREDTQSEYHTYDFLVNKDTHQTYHVKFSSESDDVLFADAVFFKNSAFTGEFITSAAAIDLIDGLEKIKSNKDFQYDSAMLSQIENLTIEDNPVLVLYTFRH